MRAADALARLYPGLNRELCVFGVFVHDLAKTWELSYETAFDYSDGGAARRAHRQERDVA